MATPVQARVQQLLTMGTAEPSLPNPQQSIAPTTPSPAFANPTPPAPPPAPLPVPPPPTAAPGSPTVGATRVYPNGKIGQWDGTGWAHVGEQS